MTTTPIQKILNSEYLSEKDRQQIQLAFDLAQEAHARQKRLSGEPYIVHPLAVASFLAELHMDSATITAALLHDTVEDCNVGQNDIEKKFGKEVGFLVDGVTKLDAVKHPGRKATDPHINNLKKMFFAVAEDIRVILIKLADRLNNMQTLQYQTPEAQKRIAMETLEIYAPIAGRLGMGRLKGQLEDLSFPYVYPEDYKSLTKKVKAQYEDRLKHTERTAPIIKRHLEDAGVQVVDVHSRVKHYWSLYQKLKRYDMDLEKVFDLVAMRIIVPDVKSCYETLGVIHKYYKPLPGRIKDYIALPKPNGYRSIHTTIFGEKGKIIEVQIRTAEMHDHAENGIAAHWAYSESGKEVVRASTAETQWINQLKNVLKEIKTKDGLKNVKIDFFKNRIFVFTPNGDVHDLPEGATPVDFAYSVHSDLGHMATGATVNGKMVRLNDELFNGDVVQILKSKKPKPSWDWLETVKTTEARRRIRSWFRDKSRI